MIVGFILDYYRLTAEKRLMFWGTNYTGRNSTNIESELRTVTLLRLACFITGSARRLIYRKSNHGFSSEAIQRVEHQAF